jgi:hypothetical protein
MASRSRADLLCRHASTNTSSSKASTLDLLSFANSSSENDAETVSLDLDSASEITMAMSVDSHYHSTKPCERMSSRASSVTPLHSHSIPSVESPSEAPLEQSSSRQSLDLEAGYFVLPDPSPSNARAVTSPVIVESNSATPTGSTRGVVEDEIASELCGSPCLKSVRVTKPALPDTMATAKEDENNFLPLLEGRPNDPRQSDIDEMLSKIGRRVENAQLAAEEVAIQSNADLQFPDVHPALRQTESRRASLCERMMALDAGLDYVANDLKSTKQSAASNHRQLSEDMERLQRDQDQLLRGWEDMRNELLEMKVTQQQLRQHVNPINGSNKQSMQSARPSVASTSLRGQSSTSPSRQVKEDAGLHGPAFKVPDPLGPYFRDRIPPENQTSTLIPDAGAHEGRQSIKGHTVKDTMSAPSMQVDSQKLQQRYHHAEHVRQFPRGCRWFSCSICRDGSYS